MSTTLIHVPASTETLVALIDADAPAKVTRPARKIASLIEPDSLVLRVPDYHEHGFAVFIGEDATVLVQEGLRDLDCLLATGSIKARGGHYPTEYGIVVMPHTGELVSATYPGKNGQAQMAWRLVHDTLVVAE